MVPMIRLSSLMPFSVPPIMVLQPRDVVYRAVLIKAGQQSNEPTITPLLLSACREAVIGDPEMIATTIQIYHRSIQLIAEGLIVSLKEL
ncbi:hypothetical protein [Pseudoduganella namucuonensis]|uniref:hypothetical protein n=1 Tax=Pseudoduganella namucuonensis TaxID=1035707 RepID=UPI000B81D5FC|nr:hypothetical protein [Pseudoduganella namucuonensis]